MAQDGTRGSRAGCKKMEKFPNFSIEELQLCWFLRFWWDFAVLNVLGLTSDLIRDKTAFSLFQTRYLQSVHPKSTPRCCCCFKIVALWADPADEAVEIAKFIFSFHFHLKRIRPKNNISQESVDVLYFDDKNISKVCFAWKWLCLLYRPNQNKRIPCVLLMLTHSLPNWSIPQLRQRRCLFSSVDKKCMYSRILMSTWQNMIFHWVFVVVAFNVVVFFYWCIRRELMFTSNQVLSCSISDSLPAAGVQPFHQNTEKNKLR